MLTRCKNVAQEVKFLIIVRADIRERSTKKNRVVEFVIYLCLTCQITSIEFIITIMDNKIF